MGLHPVHLHSRHPADAGPGGGDHGQLHGAGDVKAPGRKAKLPARCFLNLSAHFAVWVKLWVSAVDPLSDPHYFAGK